MKLLKMISWISVVCAMASVLWVAYRLNSMPPRAAAPVSAVGGR